MNSNSTAAYLGALRRFWWLGAAGVVVAALTATLMVYSVSLSNMSFHHRVHPTYTSSALLLINSAANPYLRTAVTVGTSPAPASHGATAAARSAVVHAPDTHTLVQAANLFPLLIQSDQITNLRTKMFGPLKGVVTAKTVYSFVTPSRFKPSSFPVIQIQAATGRPKAAKRLAQQTAMAFTHWIVANQNASKVPDSERIVVQELQTPKGAIASGGTKKSLPVAVALFVLLAFLGLAIMLDRFRPQGASAGRDVTEPRSPAVA